jgi:hypothetical protein
MRPDRLIPLLAVGSFSCAEATGSTDPDADAAPQLTMVEEMRVGSRDDPDTGFAAIGGVDIDRDGNIYAFESQQVEIRVYDPRGRLLRTIGRRGSGPGEFERSAVFGVAGDTVWAYESGRRMLTLFDRQGTVLATNRTEGVAVQLQSPGSVGYVLPRFMRDDGRMVGYMWMFTGGRTSGEWPVAETDTVAVPRVLFGADGTVLDTIGWDQPRLPRASDPLIRVEVGSTRYLPPRPPSEDPVTTVLPDGQVIVEMPPPAAADAAHFTVTRLGLTGDTVYQRRLKYRPKPYDDALLDSLVWRSVRTPGGGIPIIDGIPVPRPVRPDSMAAFEKIRSSIDFPEFQRPVQRVMAYDDGGIWLLRDDAGDGLSHWLVLSPEGRSRGQLALPRRTYVLWNRGETAWAVDRDEVDVPWVVRYRITSQR